MKETPYSIRWYFVRSNIQATAICRGPYHRHQQQKDSGKSDDDPPGGILLAYSAFAAEFTYFSKPGCFFIGLSGHSNGCPFYFCDLLSDKATLHGVGCRDPPSV
jgi:hypothetical protein